MDTSSFIVYIKTENIYADIANNVEARDDTSILNQTDHYQKKKNQKVRGLMKDELDGKIMK